MTIIGHVMAHRPPKRGTKAPFVITIETSEACVDVCYFHYGLEWVKRLYPLGEKKTICGTLTCRGDTMTIVHPSLVRAYEEGSVVEPYCPVYPALSSLLSSGRLRSLTRYGLTLLKEHTPPPWSLEVSVVELLEKIHFPRTKESLERQKEWLRQLAFYELFVYQIVIATVRKHHGKQQKSASLLVPGEKGEKLVEALRNIVPFTLTQAQEKAFLSIKQDMVQKGRGGGRMLHLLQGDVGSGKTIVALMVTVSVLGDGQQVAFMAPTELLARQHYKNHVMWLEKLGISSVCLTSADKGKSRKRILNGVATGEQQIVFGTHSLLQDTVSFHHLALAVIDEQQRFGVYQRVVLAKKGRGCHGLVMTATPIPRTLALAIYGDIAVSVIDEKPADRLKIETAVMAEHKLEALGERLREQLRKGRQIFWVCPKIEETEGQAVVSVQKRGLWIQELFGEEAVVMIHGRIPSAEREVLAQRFVEKKAKILLATTVIEVGIDIPTASIMVVENAERFGLSQLHQLRGRVGRNCEQSFCILLYKPPLSSVALGRLETLRDSQDGFEIAQQDLMIRGAGEILGERQSGLPRFKVVCLKEHGHLIPQAARQARKVFCQESSLSFLEERRLVSLVELFGQSLAPFLEKGRLKGEEFFKGG